MRRKARTPAADLLTTVPARDPETARYPLRTRLQPRLAWSCHQHHTPREEPGPPIGRVLGVQTLVLAVDPEVACELAPAPLGCGPGARGGESSKLSQTVGSDRAL